MNYYLDTSFVVAAITPELATPAVRAWFGQNGAANLMISDWVITEVSSALSIKLRTGQLGEQDRSQAVALFNRTSASFIMLGVTSSHFKTAAHFADQYALGLRAGDALHLAIASEGGATLCTLDHRMTNAGSALGVPTVTL